MSAATGLGPIETSLLAAYQDVGARSGDPYLKNARILEALDSGHQIAPLFGYRVVCDLARPYVSHLRLVDFHGNYGSPDFSEASAKYTESRLTPLGDVALDAENGVHPAVPIGIINGTTHLDGLTPPLAPDRVVAALRAANDGASDPELIATVGLPHFPTGCAVVADLEHFASGEPTELRLGAQIDSHSDNTVHISRLPPRSSPSDIAGVLQRLVERPSNRSDFPIADIDDTSLPGETKIVVRLTDGADAQTVATNLVQVWGLHRTITVRLANTLPNLLRTWLAVHGTDDLPTQLDPILAATGG